MKSLALLFAAAVALTPLAASAQLPVTSITDVAKQQALLKSSDPKLAANKKLVFDMWRSFIVAHHVEMADQFFLPTYMQHNPQVPTGLAPAVKYFGSTPPSAIPATIDRLVNITAEGDYVVVSLVRNMTDAKTSMPYTTTWFDMFRIENGKIAEHWDIQTK